MHPEAGAATVTDQSMWLKAKWVASCTDPRTGWERWASRTVHGTRRYARAELEHLKDVGAMSEAQLRPTGFLVNGRG